MIKDTAHPQILRVSFFLSEVCMKRQKPEKGSFGYIRYQKIIRVARTVLSFAAAFLIYLIGYLLNDGDKKNIYTVIAMLGIIPASLSCVGAIMMCMRKPMSQELYHDIREAAGSLRMAYELYFTTHDVNLFVDAAAVADGTVAAFTHEDVKQDVIRFMENHIEKSLRASGYHRKVKIFQNEKPFLERLRQMDERGGSNDEDLAVRQTILALVL